MRRWGPRYVFWRIVAAVAVALTYVLVGRYLHGRGILGVARRG